MTRFATVPIPARVAARAATRYRPGDGDCLISTYSVASHGYAQIGWQDDNGKMRGTTAHRAAWVHHAGQQVPDGQTIDHKIECRNRTCVKFEHLRVLVNLDNARRHSGRDWPLGGECTHGHDPIWWRPKGPTRKKGYCHACRSELQQRRRGSTPRKTYF